MADIAKLITQLDEALRDESTASDLRRVARILIGDPVVQTTVAPPYASTSRVERIAEDLAELRDQVAVLTDMAHGRIRPVDGPDLQRDLESLTAYVHRLEAFFNDQFVAANRSRALGDDRMNDLVTRTADEIYKVAWRVESRVIDCELALGILKMDGAPTPNYPANDPEPPIDTSWHPFNFSTDLRPDDDKHVVVMDRSGEISGPWQADLLNWCEENDATIIAWRYAKEGE